MERGAARVGRDFTLIPILVPGVFHPKCTYLSGPDGDLLLVGSGNLTFGGYGRNLEVLEVLQPNLHPESFRDFADFLDNLASSPSADTPNREWAAKFGRLARNAASGFAAEGNPPRLLHSVSRSMASQLAALATAYGGAESVTVLSPFHDGSGSAIAKLTKEIGCSKVRIALPTSPAEPSTFPFHLAFKLNLRVSAVRPAIDGMPPRPLHAKWIDLVTPEVTITLTGSVNATFPALCSSRNVEVGVVRFSEASRDHWVEAAIPELLSTQTEEQQISSSRALVYAKLSAGGGVAGRIMNSGIVSGSWKLQFEKTGNTYLDTEVAVDSSGRFAASVESPSKILSIGTMRVVMTSGGSQAVGWLEMEELVRMSLEQRSIFGALGRFLSNQATDEDDVSLLNYLAISSSHHLQEVLPEETGGQGTGSDKSKRLPTDVSLPVKSIEPDETYRHSELGQHVSHSSVNTLAHWFQQFREEVLAPSNPVESGKSAQLKRVAHPSEEAENPEDLQELERTGRALESFDRRMRQCLRETSNSETRRKLLCIWHEVSIYMLCHRLGTPEECPVFLRKWLGETVELAAAREIPESLEQFFFTSVAILAFFAKQEDSGNSLRALHEALEGFCRREVTEGFANEALDRRWAQGVARSIIGVDDPKLDEYLAVVLKTPTSLKDAHALLEALRDGKVVDVEAGIFLAASRYGHELAAELKSLIERGIAYSHMCPRTDGLLDCSCCYEYFSKVARMSYSTKRIAKCQRCGKFNLRLRP